MAESAVTPIYATLRTEARAFVRGRHHNPQRLLRSGESLLGVVLVWGQSLSM